MKKVTILEANGTDATSTANQIKSVTFADKRAKALKRIATQYNAEIIETNDGVEIIMNRSKDLDNLIHRFETFVGYAETDDDF